MIAKHGHATETVQSSDVVIKVNRRNKPQERVIMMTDRAIYNILPTNYKKCHPSSNEFIIHIPSEYDYRFISLRRNALLQSMRFSRHDLRGLVVQKDMSSKQRKIVQLTVNELRDITHDGMTEEPSKQMLQLSIGQTCPSNDRSPPLDFKLSKVIGRGSFGKVYLVQKCNGVDRAIIERNQIDFPFLMKLHYAFQTETKLYFVMDYLPGGELFFHLKNEHKLDESRARFYAAEIALGIGHLHSKNIIYRDLKPENILLDRDGHIRMTDFGLSKGNMTSGATTMTFCGTPEYLAPEIVKGKPHDKEVDWWSLGILIYEMLAGVPPFYSDNVHLMYRLIETSPVRFPPRMSNTIRDLITKLLHRDPRKRLGCQRDLDEIKCHPWFAGLDWEKLTARKLSPPFKPAVKGEADISNVDRCFTQEAVPTREEPETEEERAFAKGADFTGFSFAPKAGVRPKQQ
eukprot:GSMAST32.ASY1.ANO1.2527.1 assembled CDS